jgi:hypothetical protein
MLPPLGTDALLNPLPDLVIGRSCRHEAAEVIAIDAGLLEEMLVHGAAKLEFAAPADERSAAFVEAPRGMRFTAQLFLGRPRFLVPKIAGQFPNTLQVFHSASCTEGAPESAERKCECGVRR